MSQLDLIAACAFGLESVVVRELAALGYDARPGQTGRVHFSADEAAIARANLWLRSADRVLVRLGNFPAKDFGELFDHTFALPWERWIAADAEFPVNGRSLKSQLSSVPACQKIVKKAIVEKLKTAHGVATLPESGPRASIEVALDRDEATLVLDTTGPSLHKRGYRRLTGEAQLKETMAAALVLLSRWTPERPLADPCCGTGTIPIEAALIGRNIAPGMLRSFSAEGWPTLDADVWRRGREEARDLAKPDMPVRIIGSDIDAEALSQARYHAEQAGVAEQIHFQQQPFAELTSSRQFGCVITNPPYGLRLGSDAEVESLHRAMPEVFRRLPTWSFFVLTAYPQFEKLVGQKATRRRKLYNGRIECTYYQFFGPKGPRSNVQGPKADAEEGSLPQCNEEGGTMKPPTSQSSGPPSSAPRQAFGGLTPKGREQAELFRSRLAKRARHLRRWPSRGVTCYRLYDRDIPEVPLVVDRYENCLHVAEYERPHERTPAEHADWLDLMVRTACEILNIAPGDVYLKRRERQIGDSQYDRWSDEGRVIEVGEGGLKFLVNLSDYLDTGLFLDHRATRSLVRDEAVGKRFINLFAYTGSFSVYAAAGGAATTTSVDLSATYLDWARRNMALNGFTSEEHRFTRADAMSFLADHPPGAWYDLAVVDPPTFSKSKKLEGVWDVQRDHAELLRRLLALMSPDGVVFFSSNFRRFKLAETALPNATLREITRKTVPEDFRNQRIHRAWRIVKQNSA